MNILKSLFILGAVVVLTVGTTYAFFSDSGTNTGNTFAAGTLDLKLSDANEIDQDSITTTWTMPSMAPGDSVSGSMTLKNTGTIAANHVEIGPVTNTVADVGIAANPDIDAYLQITAASYDGDDLLTAGGIQLVDSNGNGWIDLDDLESAANSGEGSQLDNLSAPAANGLTTKVLSMTITFNSLAGNEYQGDSDVMALTVTLNQSATQ